MADCEKFMQLCDESLGRTLDEKERESLDAHLQSCPGCAAYLADLQFIADALAEEPPLPAALHESIMGGILDEVHSTIVQTRQPNRRPPVVGMLVAAAACVALVLSGALGNLLNTFDFFVAGGGSAGSASGADAASADMEDIRDAVPMPAGYDDGMNAAPAAQDNAAPAETVTQSGMDYPDAGQPQTRAAKDMPETGSAEGEAGSADAEPQLYAEITSDEGEGYQMIVDGRTPARTGQPQPQVGAFINSVMEGQVFAACYLIEGGEELPEIGQEQQRDEYFGYYVVDNNLAQLETLLGSLEKAGCSVSAYEESGVLFNESARQVIFIVRLDG